MTSLLGHRVRLVLMMMIVMILMMTMFQVSFMKGDSIILYSQASSDWWRGCVGGREGLIPDKYVLIKIR